MAAAVCCKCVIDTPRELETSRHLGFQQMLCELRYPRAYFFGDRRCAVVDSCESQLDLRRELQEWSILLPSVVCFVELTSTATADKSLFGSFISIGNCHYQEFLCCFLRIV